MAQGGDYENCNGSGGQAFEGGTLQDESFANKHDQAGILSMANKGKNTAGSQFFITLGRSSHLNGKHVAFGRVVEGMDVITEMGKVETDEKDKPVAMQKITIVDCGKGDGKDDKNALDLDSSSMSSSKDRKVSSRKRSKSSRHDEHKSKKKRKERRDYDSDHSSSSRSKRRKKKSSKRHKKEKYSSDEHSYFSSEEDSYRDKKRSKKRKKHSSRKDRKRSRAYSSDESSLSERDRKHHKKHKKTSKEKSSERKKSKNGDKTGDGGGGSTKNAFGKFGIVKESDFHSSSKIKRSYEVWLAEIKGIPQGSNMVSQLMLFSTMEVLSFSLSDLFKL